MKQVLSIIAIFFAALLVYTSMTATESNVRGARALGSKSGKGYKSGKSGKGNKSDGSQDRALKKSRKGYKSGSQDRTLEKKSKSGKGYKSGKSGKSS